MRIRIEPPDYMEQGHRPNTAWIIERVVEFAEDAVQPFTRTEAWRHAFGHYSITVQTIASMKRAGLLLVTNPGGKPELLISRDRYPVGGAA